MTLPTGSGAGDEATEEDRLAQTFVALDDIRFTSYRTAAKLRSLQKQSYLYHIDIWNMIEAFRENGLHGMDPSAKLTEAKVRSLLKSLYDNLQKRLPPSQQQPNSGPNTNSSSSSSSLMPPGNSSSGLPGGSHSALQVKSELLLTFLWRALVSGSSDRVKVRAIKTALATLCAGKLMDKLRYIFSQLSDQNGQLIHTRFVQFLRDVMKIPAALGEYTSFGEEGAKEIIFAPEDKVTVNDFLETMMSDPGPQCLSWLLVLHRLVNSESVYHPISCGNCLIQGYYGLRYKSDRANYHLCQNCFWRGRISDDHVDDIFKEYNSFKTSSGKSSLKKLHCMPSDKRSSKSIPRFPEEPEKPIDLSNMIPSVSGSINSSLYREVVDPDEMSWMNPTLVGGDEHTLIAQYANQLAQDYPPEQTKRSSSRGPSTSPGKKVLRHSKQIVQDLERRNKEIMRNITQLRQYRDMDEQRNYDGNPEIVSELTHLRMHKEELEDRLSELQDTRKELMNELEELMKLLQGQKVSPNNMDRFHPQMEVNYRMHNNLYKEEEGN